MASCISNNHLSLANYGTMDCGISVTNAITIAITIAMPFPKNQMDVWEWAVPGILFSQFLEGKWYDKNHQISGPIFRQTQIFIP